MGEQVAVEDLVNEIKTLMEEYQVLSVKEREIKHDKEQLRKRLDGLIQDSGLGVGNKIASDSATMTITQRENVISVRYEDLEPFLGDHVDEYIEKKLNLKLLREAVDSGDVDENALNCVLVQKSDPTFMIRGFTRYKTTEV